MATPPTTMSCISWNCRGLGSPCAIQELKTLIRSHNPALVFLMETRLTSNKLLVVKNSLGFKNGFLVERSCQSGGLIMLCNKELEIRLLSYSLGHIDVWVGHDLLEGGCFLTGFYDHWYVP